ncbi:unnamed protein product [Schistosoma margrebowiei]|uniref:Uncharacterized protein n=1 Tax=Schistosoma margrebowiei TaxID=48269 RepID=A0A3P8BFN1_9TREM|nr:unnamed protein product [Schistosoma margrebowiei]
MVIWEYLHLRVDVHSGTRTQYRSLQMNSAMAFGTSYLYYSEYYV